MYDYLLAATSILAALHTILLMQNNRALLTIFSMQAYLFHWLPCFIFRYHSVCLALAELFMASASNTLVLSSIIMVIYSRPISFLVSWYYLLINFMAFRGLFASAWNVLAGSTMSFSWMND